jgi:hypothetical protein
MHVPLLYPHTVWGMNGAAISYMGTMPRRSLVALGVKLLR